MTTAVLKAVAISFYWVNEWAHLLTDGNQCTVWSLQWQSRPWHLRFCRTNPGKRPKEQYWPVNLNNDLCHMTCQHACLNCLVTCQPAAVLRLLVMFGAVLRPGSVDAIMCYYSQMIFAWWCCVLMFLDIFRRCNFISGLQSRCWYFLANEGFNCSVFERILFTDVVSFTMICPSW